MSDEIRPALTPEQWVQKRVEGLAVVDGDGLGLSYLAVDNPLDAEDRHALAAMCLHEQPFGFTRADLELLQLVTSRLEPHKMADVVDEKARLANLGDRIEMLLAP